MTVTKKSKAASAAGVLLVASLALAACGGNSNNGGNAASSAPAGGASSPAASKPASDGGKAVTISYTIWDKNQQPAMEAIAKAFTEKNPNIKVKVDVIPWGNYWTKMSAAAPAGTLPDVFWMHGGQFIKYATGKFLEPITDKVQAGEINLDDYAARLAKL